MSRQVVRVSTEKLSVSLPVEMVDWLKAVAQREEAGNVSAAIRRRLQPIYDGQAGEQRPRPTVRSVRPSPKRPAMA